MQRRFTLLLTLSLLAFAGCTGPREYIRNGFKVGPNYCPPGAPVADRYIDAADKRVEEGEDDLAGWWTVFGDPLLNNLITQANDENLTLRQAGYRILAARAQLAIAVGNAFPQLQTLDGDYQRLGIGDTFTDQWSSGFNLAWELDFWGRYRRAIAAADDILNSSVADYDSILVTLLSDVASNYVRYRTTEERIRLLKGTIQIQEDVLVFLNEQVEQGAITDVDRAQGSSNLNQSLAQLDQLEIELRQSQNQLCILLGMPPTDLTALLASGPKRDIPEAPDFVVVGIPADLLRRRPDVRRAELDAAAQGEFVGIAEADLYPSFAITGRLGWQASSLSDLFSSEALASNVGFGFNWNILNYGRILNNTRLQEALFRELVAAYQQTVLQAALEVENGIVSFLQNQERTKNLEASVDDSYLALEIVVAQYEAGLPTVEFNQYAVIQQTLIQQQDLWAQSRGQIALSLIEVYRALGGGWQIKQGDVPDKQGILSPAVPVQPEAVQPGVVVPAVEGNVELPPADGGAPQPVP